MIPTNNPILYKTNSVCPVCLKRVTARYTTRGDEIWMEKECREHGHFEVLFWQGVEHFQNWRRFGSAQPPAGELKPVKRGCPYDCGLCQSHRQAPCCVLLEVTERCNLNCPICFASAGQDAADPTLAEIDGWYERLLAQGGPFNIQLSGGEPTLRTDLAAIIRLGKEKGFPYFQLNTNGRRLARDPFYLHKLKEAGLDTVFLQFDSPFGAATKRLRGEDLLAEKRQALQNCANEGLGVVLVPTLMRGCNDGDIGALLEFAAAWMPTVRGVHFQPLSYFGRYNEVPRADSRITLPELLRLLEEQSAGRVRAADFAPGGAEHPLCSFHADYTVQAGRWQRQSASPAACGCGAAKAAPGGSSDIARAAVALKWRAPEPPAAEPLGAGFDVHSLDAYLEQKTRQTLAISAMAFQDAWTLDLERLGRCYINIVSPQGQLIPFCAYNLTSVSGQTLYRQRKERG